MIMGFLLYMKKSSVYMIPQTFQEINKKTSRFIVNRDEGLFFDELVVFGEDKTLEFGRSDAVRSFVTHG